MGMIERIWKKIFAFAYKHRMLVAVVATITTIINAGIIVTNPSNIISGIAFALCIPGVINLILSKTGHIFFSHDVMWRVLKSRGKEGQYKERCLKIANILILVGIPLTLLGIIIEIF